MVKIGLRANGNLIGSFESFFNLESCSIPGPSFVRKELDIDDEDDGIF